MLWLPRTPSSRLSRGQAESRPQVAKVGLASHRSSKRLISSQSFARGVFTVSGASPPRQLWAKLQPMLVQPRESAALAPEALRT